MTALKVSPRSNLRSRTSGCEHLKNSDTAQSEALKLILLDRILWLGQSYINKGEISFDDRRRFHAMHSCYHSGLGGNGDADIIVEGVDALPLKK